MHAWWEVPPWPKSLYFHTIIDISGVAFSGATWALVSGPTNWDFEVACIILCVLGTSNFGSTKLVSHPGWSHQTFQP